MIVKLHDDNINIFADNRELNSLYQEIIQDHNKNPRHKGIFTGADCAFCQEGKNPLCGDTIFLSCRFTQKPNASMHFKFQGSGCSISQASASIMCEWLEGVHPKEAMERIESAERIYKGEVTAHDDVLEEDVGALFGVSKFPVRIKCAALPWKAAELILKANFDKTGALKIPHASDEPVPCRSTSDNCIKKLKIVTTE